MTQKELGNFNKKIIVLDDDPTGVQTVHGISVYTYEILRDKILNGELPSGMKIVEEKLAAELGVSRTPIRDSIRKLEHEGLVVQKRVVKPTEKDLRNMFSVRILLEGYSARCAANFLKENEIEKTVRIC